LRVKVDESTFLAVVVLIVIMNGSITGTISTLPAEAQSKNDETSATDEPRIMDPNLKVELVYKGPGFPTNMAFVGPDDILLLSKNDGHVMRIKDGKNLGPVLTLNVSGKDEMGLLGISTDYGGQKNLHVFIFYSLCNSKTDCNNFVYRYDWIEGEGKLISPRLLIKLPGLPGPSHIGGEMTIGPDKYLYVTVGDMTPSKLFNMDKKYLTKAQNYVDGVEADGRAGILRVTQDGKPVDKGIIGSTSPLNLYYAYGIKNSFGLGFDPLTGNLWDTENGPRFGDEINLVEPGFNSGWSKVQGGWNVGQTAEKTELIGNTNPNNLVDFDGKGKYTAPKLVWDSNVAPTALVFLNSTKLGSQYLNDMFIGSVDGKISHFKLNENRTELNLPKSTTGKILSEDVELTTIFGQDFEIITDLHVGPYDGYLYVVSADRPNKAGAIYRILANSLN
jgi:aldose sugar dehydrogenase